MNGSQDTVSLFSTVVTILALIHPTLISQAPADCHVLREGWILLEAIGYIGHGRDAQRISVKLRDVDVLGEKPKLYLDERARCVKLAGRFHRLEWKIRARHGVG